MVDVLERDGQGLNLTEQVRDGILNHTGSDRPETLEGRIVKLVDRVAYINHDIDDALRAGVLRPADLPAAEIELLGPTGSARIDTLVRDIVERSAAAGDIAQSEEVGAAASTSGRSVPCAAFSTTTWSTRARCPRGSRARATANGSPTTWPG